MTTVLPDATPSTSFVNATTEADLHHEEQAHHHEHPHVILFIFGCCGFGALLRIIIRKWSDFVADLPCGKLLKIPYTVFLLIVGMILAAIGMQHEVVKPFLISDMDPELFLHIFLPVVIFESAYVIDIHVFWRSIGHVSLLAVPGLLISTMLTALLSFVIPEIGNIADIEIRFYVALIFGALVSATDPVAVVALLKELGNQKYLGTIIEGEALLNDGAAIVVFKIFLEMLTSVTSEGGAMDSLAVFTLIAQQSLLGPVMGFLFARFASFLLQQIYNDGLSEITLTLSFTYMTFYFGELAKTSGVLAVVVFGLALDRSSITPQIDHFLHEFWEMLAYLANTLIFVIVGIQITYFMGEITWWDVVYLILIYIGTTLIRMFSICLFYPFMKNLGIDLTWRHVLVMTWGGLRGAVGLALAIYLNSYAYHVDGGSPHTPHQEYAVTTANMTLMYTTVHSDIDFRHIFQKILLHTGGIVLLTLIINAATIEAVLGKLGMLDITTAQQVTMLNAVNRIQEDIRRSIGVLKFDRFLADARWSMVSALTSVEYPYKEFPTTDTVRESIEYSKKNGRLEAEIVKHTASEDETHKAIFEEARLRLIKALKMSYWKQYSNGMLTDQEARVLVSAADTAADKPGEFIDINTIKKCWAVTGFLPWAKAKLEDMQYGKKSATLEPPGRNRHIRRLFRIVNSDYFEYTMQFLIVLNIVPIALDFAVDETWNNAIIWWNALQIVNMIFIAFYTVEAAMKFIGLGVRQYFKDRWNWFDVGILLFSYIEVIVDLVLVEGSTPGATSIAKLGKTTKVLKFGKVAKSIRVLRLSRVLRLTKTIIPKSINLINKYINKRLSFGYDVGKGFVTAEEEVSKLIESISDNPSIRDKLMKVSTNNRLFVIRELGLLQRDHPGIAISVKTRSAVRSILNQTANAIQRLSAGGVLDEIEGNLLEKNVEIKLKRQSDFPANVEPPLPEDLLTNIPWMSGDRTMSAFFRDRSIKMDYDYGDIIMEEGDESDGIHVVIYGMIKLSGELLGQVQNIKFNSLMLAQDDEEYVQEDFLSSGNIIGEIGILTNKPRSCTVMCETAVQTFFMSTDDMLLAFELFSGLKNDIWKVVASRITAPLYNDHIQYQAMSLEEIHLHLARGYIVELNDANPRFRFNDGIMEVSVVYGTVFDPLAAEVIQSPRLVFPEHEELRLHETPTAILLIIPRDIGILEMVKSDTLALQGVQSLNSTESGNLGNKIRPV